VPCPPSARFKTDPHPPLKLGLDFPFIFCRNLLFLFLRRLVWVFDPLMSRVPPPPPVTWFPVTLAPDYLFSIGWSWKARLRAILKTEFFLGALRARAPLPPPSPFFPSALSLGSLEHRNPHKAPYRNLFCKSEMCSLSLCFSTLHIRRKGDSSSLISLCDEVSSWESSIKGILVFHPVPEPTSALYQLRTGSLPGSGCRIFLVLF